MPKLIITGKVTLDFKQILDVPDDELENFVFDDEGKQFDEENIICNIDLDNATWDVDQYDMLEVRWCVHVEDPDDILAMPTKDFAERVAANLNKGFDELKGDDIHIEAKVIPYPYTKESFDRGMDAWSEMIAEDWG